MLRILALLAWGLVSLVHAQSSPNATSLVQAYEGILAYLAYQLDLAANNGKSLTIDPDCSAQYDGQSYCTFEEFLEDIIHVNQALIIKGIVFQTTNIDELAEQMIQGGAAGPWNAKALFGGIIQNSDDAASLLFHLGGYVGENLGASTGLTDAVNTAFARISFLRGALNLSDVQQIFKSQLPNAVIKQISRALYPGGPLFNLFDLGGTAAANPGANFNNFKAAVNAANQLPAASMNNVRAARSGQIAITPGCKS